MSTTPIYPTKEELQRRQALEAEMQYLGQMASTETAMFHHVAAESLGLTISDTKTLSILMQEGPQAANQLAKRLGLTPGGVTSVIDRIEKAGFAKRVPDPRDRRKVMVESNMDQLSHLESPYDSVGISFQKLLSNYSTEQIQFLVDYYKAMIDQTKIEIAKLAAKQNLLREKQK